MIPLEDWDDEDLNHPMRRHRLRGFVTESEPLVAMRDRLGDLLSYFDVQARQKELRALAYAAYLESDHWKIVRRQALQRALYACERCGQSKHLNVHHLTYVRLGAEEPDDLEVLCRGCHKAEHGIEAA